MQLNNYFPVIPYWVALYVLKSNRFRITLSVVAYPAFWYYLIFDKILKTDSRDAEIETGNPVLQTNYLPQKGR